MKKQKMKAQMAKNLLRQKSDVLDFMFTRSRKILHEVATADDTADHKYTKKKRHGTNTFIFHLRTMEMLFIRLQMQNF
jgi:hypothetical protein